MPVLFHESSFTRCRHSLYSAFSLFPDYFGQIRVSVKSLLSAADVLCPVLLAILPVPRYYVNMQGKVLWITGLPGSGKSTVADAVKQQHPDVIILRMDELRKIVTPVPAYSDNEREMVYRCLVYLAKTLSDLGHNVIIDATGNLRKWRDLARGMIPSFTEVYLKCSLEKCAERERQRKDTRGAPRDIYEKGKAGWPVPGVNVPYEEPLNPDVTIDTEKFSAAEAADTISSLLTGR